MRSLSTGATGMMAQQLNVEVISNNIANMSTTAFKRQRASSGLLYQNQRRPGATSSNANTIVPWASRSVSACTPPACTHPRAGQPDLDRQQLRSRHQRQGHLPDHPALRRNRLYPRRLFPGEWPGPAGRLTATW